VDAERAHIMNALRESNWVIGGQNGAAAQLGLPRSTLIAMMDRLGISRERSVRRIGQPDRRIVVMSNRHSPDSVQENNFRQMEAAAGRI